MGPSAELRLRVSAAALVRVTFAHPRDRSTMLALERKATLRADGSSVQVSAQPFGGGSRILQAEMLREEIGNFHFDSQRVKNEHDFRILIRPEDWQAVKACCLRHFRAGDNPVLESDPRRELAEEFGDTLRVILSDKSYRLSTLGMLCENQPAATDNLYGGRLPTARIYHLFEAELIDLGLIQRVLASSEGISDAELERLAQEDAHSGGRGRANAVLALGLDELVHFYQELPVERRNEAVWVEGHHLSGNAAAVLSEVSAPKYERFTP